ncbi:MAG: anthranilate synthase component I, partial [Caulobacteraceae bacterium]
MSTKPEASAFAAAYGRGEAQVVWTRLIDDLETPVSAYLKVGFGQPFAFLFESVEGGSWRGRYSFITLKPDLVWRCFGDRAEVAQGAGIAAGDYRAEDRPALESLRRLVEASRIELPAELPPMAAGLFGAIGYDMIRLAEPLGPAKPDALGLPDGVMTRPSVVAVFDSVAQEIVLITSVRPSALSAEAAYAEAAQRLADTQAELARPLDR